MGIIDRFRREEDYRDKLLRQSREADKKAEQKALKRGSKIKKRHQEAIDHEKKMTTLARKAEVLEEKQRIEEAKTRKKMAKKARKQPATGLFDFKVKKKKQGKKIKKRTSVKLF